MNKVPPTIEEFEAFKLKRLEKHRVTVAENRAKNYEVAIHQIIQAMKRGVSECTLSAIPKQYRESTVGAEIVFMKEILDTVFVEYVMSIVVDHPLNNPGYKVSWYPKGQSAEKTDDSDEHFSLPDDSDTEDVNYATGDPGVYTGFLT